MNYEVIFVRTEPEVHAALREFALAEGLSLNEAANLAVVEFLERNAPALAARIAAALNEGIAA